MHKQDSCSKRLSEKFFLVLGAMTHQWVTAHLGDMRRGPPVGYSALKTGPHESLPQQTFEITDDINVLGNPMGFYGTSKILLREIRKLRATCMQLFAVLYWRPTFYGTKDMRRLQQVHSVFPPSNVAYTGRAILHLLRRWQPLLHTIGIGRMIRKCFSYFKLIIVITSKLSVNYIIADISLIIKVLK